MAQAMVGSTVKVLKGSAKGTKGTIRAALWLPSGDHMFGIELDEPNGLNDGRYKVIGITRWRGLTFSTRRRFSPYHCWQDGTPYFSCKKGYGIYLKMDSFIPEGVRIAVAVVFIAHNNQPFSDACCSPRLRRVRKRSKMSGQTKRCALESYSRCLLDAYLAVQDGLHPEGQE